MTSIYLPNYSIGENAYTAINEVIKPYGKKIVFIGGKTALSKAQNKIESHLDDAYEVLASVWYLGEASQANVDKLKQDIHVQACDMIFAIGGGKACDTCKMLAHQLDKPIFTFPTIAATCASITSLCALYTNDGVFVGPYERSKPADHTFIDTQIISEAPAIYLWAGIGDTLAKGFEPEISARLDQLDNVTLSGITLSSLCYKPVLTYAKQAMDDCQHNTYSYALEQIVSAIIVNTGIVSNYLPFIYNTGLAHAICYGCTTIKAVEKNHLHGELVAYGLLIQCLLDKKTNDLDKLIRLYQSINLPTKLQAIGLTIEQLPSIIEFALQTKDIEHFAIPLDKEKIINACLQLESY